MKLSNNESDIVVKWHFQFVFTTFQEINAFNFKQMTKDAPRPSDIHAEIAKLGSNMSTNISILGRVSVSNWSLIGRHKCDCYDHLPPLRYAIFIACWRPPSLDIKTSQITNVSTITCFGLGSWIPLHSGSWQYLRCSIMNVKGQE